MAENVMNSPTRPRHGSLTILWLGLFCAVLSLGLFGCGSGDLTAPDDIRATWSEIEFSTLQNPDLLTIDQNGDISITGNEQGPETGILSPDSWRALETVISRVELDPISIEPRKQAIAGDKVGEGLFLLHRDGETFGFIWQDPENLTLAEEELVSLLQRIRDNALIPISERVNIFHGVRLLHGFDAAIDHPAQYLIRDEDTLLTILRNDLGRETVVMPQIDFDRDVVLAIFLGPRSHENFDLQIWSEISLMVGGFFHLSIDKFSRAPGCPIPEGNGGAFELIRIPRLDKEIYLDWNMVESGCTDTAFQ